MVQGLFADWESQDVDELVRLMQKFAAGLKSMPEEA